MIQVSSVSYSDNKISITFYYTKEYINVGSIISLNNKNFIITEVKLNSVYPLYTACYSASNVTTAQLIKFKESIDNKEFKIQ